MRYLCTFIGLILGYVSSVSAPLLTFDAYLEWVKTHHPIALQAGLLDAQTAAYLLKAKGQFDPTIAFNLDQKSFEDKNYYQTVRGVLKIPTWIGADIKLAYENNSGQFLDPSYSTPSEGLINAGITIPLGNGLFFDERRQAIREAQLLGERNILKQQQILNKLFYNAALAYLEWQVNYAQYEIQEQNVALGKERVFQLARSVEEGDRPAIDSVEAGINLRARQFDLAKAEQALNYSRQQLNTFLWEDGLLPLELDSLTDPEPINPERWSVKSQQIAINLQEVLTKHPLLQQYDNDIQQYQIERKLQREMLKPSVDLTFTPLSNVRTIGQYNLNDYKFGVQVYYPLLVRKARGEIQLIDLDIQQTEMESANVEQQILNTLRTLTQNEPLYIQQLNLVNQNVIAYQQLLDAENRKFEIGESLLFLVNNREQKLFETQLKRTDTQFELLANRLKIIAEAQNGDEFL